MTAMNESLIRQDRLGRMRFTREQREDLLDACEASGLTGPQFAALHGVAYQAFATFWLKPLHQRLHQGLFVGDYLQADETPVRYLVPGSGKAATGYLWTLHRPRGDVVYQWHPSRRQDCLNDLLGDHRGTLQCDGYAAYPAHANKHPGLQLAACWAHVRRKFNEALHHHLIGLRGHPSVLPKSALGRAIDYTLGLWDRLCVYLGNGHVEIDNNGIENAIRPTAIGKKNWLFIGREDTGERSAVLYTLIESAKRARPRILRLPQ